MKRLLRNLRLILVLFIVLSVALLAGLLVQQRRSLRELSAVAGENKAVLHQEYAKAGRIITADGRIVADSSSGERRYSDDWSEAVAMLPVVGDYTHNMTNTIESQMQGALLGNRHDLIRQLMLDLTWKGHLGDDVVLTIDSGLQQAAYEALGGAGGAVVVLNYETGDIPVLVSSPSTEPQNVIEWENVPDTALFNRALNAQYTPGSTFKIITASAWLLSDEFDQDRTCVCLGDTPIIPGGAFENYDHVAHGEVALAGAFSQSCNAFFADVGLEIGAERLTETAKLFGFGHELGCAPLFLSKSEIDLITDDAPNLTWSAIGQPAGASVLTVTPLHMAMIGGAIANDGVMCQPHLVDHLLDPSGRAYAGRSVSTVLTLPGGLASDLQQLMLYAVESGYASAAGLYGRTIGGKTGTAEATDGEGNRQVHRLFIGFDLTEGYPYAIAVVSENESANAAAIAGQVLSQIGTIGP
jgi:peptidoglycan glycosyltransferase